MLISFFPKYSFVITLFFQYMYATHFHSTQYVLRSSLPFLFQLIREKPEDLISAVNRRRIRPEIRRVSSDMNGRHAYASRA